MIKPSTRLGPYQIVARIGAGGMGEVWRARDTRIGRDVAIKILPPEFASSADRLHRFEQEARAAGGLNHPNLVTIHDLGTDDGVPYIVMELLEGETLRERIGPEGAPRIPIRKAIDLSVQIASGQACIASRVESNRQQHLDGDAFRHGRDGRVRAPAHPNRFRSCLGA